MKANEPTNKERERARRLIASPAHRGNHGFKGAQLTAWRTQRTRYLAVLRDIRAGKVITWARLMWMESARCPRYTGGAQAWGTDAGAAWVGRTDILAYRIATRA